ncbi:hypothetical protein ACN6MY_10830 [Peribacillus sp. B-H-3]|uniref:hypothetical protein n=1 Tax=Peribacillus sp. B-H-3 TaxID=3400420 RepID=UPI003B025FE8
MGEYVSKVNCEDKVMIFIFKKKPTICLFVCTRGLAGPNPWDKEITGKTVFDMYKDAPDLAQVIIVRWVGMESMWNAKYTEKNTSPVSGLWPIKGQ